MFWPGPAMYIRPFGAAHARGYQGKACTALVSCRSEPLLHTSGMVTTALSWSVPDVITTSPFPMTVVVGYQRPLAIGAPEVHVSFSLEKSVMFGSPKPSLM